MAKRDKVFINVEVHVNHLKHCMSRRCLSLFFYYMTIFMKYKNIHPLYLTERFNSAQPKLSVYTM